MARLLKIFLLIALALGTIIQPSRPAQGYTESDAIAPRVLSSTPEPYEEVEPTKIISVVFDQAMDQASVTHAITFQRETTASGDPDAPPVFSSAGVTTAWQDDLTLNVTPEKIERGGRYLLTIGTTAKSRAGLPLEQAFRLTFDGATGLVIQQVIPADKAEVEPNSTITVLFSRPVVPLVDTGNQAGLPQPLQFSPAVTGRGEWVNTSVYVYKPDPQLAGGTAYTITIDPTLRDINGSGIDGGYRWSFRTLPPRVLTAAPNMDERSVVPERTIDIVFTQPMNTTSVEKAFVLKSADGEPVPGTFTWNEFKTAFNFKPNKILQIAKTYRYVLTGGEGIGGASIPAGITGEFSTLPLPAIQGIHIYNYDGETRARISINFNTHIDPASLIGKISVSPEVADLAIDNSFSLTAVGIVFLAQPSQYYRLVIAPGIRDKWGNTIRQEFHTSFITNRAPPVPPQLPPTPPTAFNVLTTGAISVTNAYLPETTLQSELLNVKTVEMGVAPIEMRDYGKLRNPNDGTLTTIPPNFRKFTLDAGFVRDQKRSFTLHLAENRGALPPGLYVVTVEVGITAIYINDPQHRNARFLSVSTANLTMKRTTSEVLIWATDLKTGQPVRDTEITLYKLEYRANPERVTSITSIRTDAQGIARYPLAKANEYSGLIAVLRSADGKQYGIGGENVGVLNTGAFGVPFTQSNPRLDQYFYTDQAIYRPGRPVYFRGILRNRDDVNFTIPPDRALTMKIYNPENQVVYEKALTISDYGTYAGQFDLSADPKLGYYRFEAIYQSAPLQVGSFQVEEYRVPEFQVNAVAGKSDFVRGTPAKATFDAQFYFGAPVSSTRVNWAAGATPTWFNYTGAGGYAFGDSGGYVNRLCTMDYYYGEPYYGGNPPRIIASGAGVTGSDGQFVLEFSPETSMAQPELVTLEATVTDSTNQVMSARTNITVHPAEYYVGMRPDVTLAQTLQPVKVQLATVDLDSRPVANRSIKLRAALFTCRRVGDSWQFERVEIEIAVGNATTNADGTATWEFNPPQAGLYQIAGESVDSGGRVARTTAAVNVWALSPPPDVVFEPLNPNKTLAVTSPRRAYKPGETADILIVSPFPVASTALVTVERAGIMKHEIITVSGTTTYRLPITDQYAPDVYVAVTLIKPMQFDPTQPLQIDPNFRYGLLKLNVEVRQALTVKLTPDQSKGAPGQKIRFDVQTTDREGKPVSAAIGLKLTDLATLALSDASLNIASLFNLFWNERGHSVHTEVSMQALIDWYKPKPPQPLPTPTPTATPASASAAPTPTQLATRIAISGGGDSNGADGDGGGPSAMPVTGGGAATLQARTNYVDTPLWRPDVITDADGRAQVEITLPDNLTTWRLDARGISRDTYVGQATSDVISTKPLLVRPATPRFFVVGDKPELATIVNNYTDTDQSVQVSLSAEGVTLLDPPVYTVTIPRNGRTRVSWKARVNAVEFVKVVFSARAGDFVDAAAPDVGIGDNRLLPVYRYVAPDSVSTAGVLTAPGARTEGILLPKGLAAAQSGKLTIQVDASLADVALAGLGYLEHYPYECTEQTVSRFLPNLLTYRALQKLGQDRPELRANLKRLITTALDKLAKTQKPDGGWGWYTADQSDVNVTAYVVFALNEVLKLDQELSGLVNAGVLDRGIKFVVDKAVRPNRSFDTYALNRSVFIEYVLSGVKDGFYFNRLALDALTDQAPRMSLFAQAWLAQTWARTGTDQAKVDALVASIQSKAILSATGTHWEENERDWWLWSSDTRSTAIILQTLVRVSPGSALIPNVVRWLMTARRGDAWETTQETAWSVMALTDFMVATGELEGNYNATIAFNGASIYTGEIKAQQEFVQTFDSATLKALSEQVGRLVFRRGEGKGSLYYTANLHLEQPVEAIRAVNRGFSISRQYLINGKPVTEAKGGELITVALEVVVNRGVYYVVLNDPIPAGTEMVLNQNPQPQNLPYSDAIPFEYMNNWGWFSSAELKTEQAVLTARYLPAGTYHYTYTIRATTPGTYRVIPPNGQEFYFPEVFGRGEGAIFTVR